MREPPSFYQMPSQSFWTHFCRWLRRQRSTIWGTLFGIIFNIFATWLITPRSTSLLRDTPLGFLLDFYWLIYLLGIGLIALTIGVELVGRWAEKHTSIPLKYPSQLSSAQRASIIRLLYQEYRKRLEQSLQGAIQITLNLNERTDVIHSSAQLVFHRTPITNDLPLPPGTSIIKAYDDAGQGLLILGAPGSGKTTLLLNLAQELVARAQNKFTHQLPFILNLSSWVNQKLNLELWFINQISLIYGIPTSMGKTLLAQEQYVLLLDGLDEVDPSERGRCIDAINDFRAKHFIPLIVCSRSQEYLQQKIRLNFSTAIEIRSLTEKEVNAYLKQLGKPMAAVRSALRINPVLKELLSTPLMLYVVVLTYRDRIPKDLSQFSSAEKQQQYIFEQYVKRMLLQRPDRNVFTPQQTQRWLGWLAQQMQRQHLTEFYLEGLQPTWLPLKSAKQFRLITLLIFGLFFGLPIGLLIGLLIEPFFGLPIGLLIGLLIGLIFGLSGGVLNLKIEESGQTIKVQDHLKWSWEHILRRLPFGVGIGLGLGLLSGLIFGLFFRPNMELLSKLIIGLIFGCISLFSYLLGVGLSGVPTNEDQRKFPNQGVYRSGWNALRILLIAQIFFGLGGGAIGILLFGLGPSLIFGLLVGLVVGLEVALTLGGVTYLQHYLLRYLLWRKGAIPWRYVRFLEESTERILLQRIGGGYRFIHPLFQEFFAKYYADASSCASPKTS